MHPLTISLQTKNQHKHSFSSASFQNLQQHHQSVLLLSVSEASFTHGPFQTDWYPAPQKQKYPPPNQPNNTPPQYCPLFFRQPTQADTAQWEPNLLAIPWPPRQWLSSISRPFVVTVQDSKSQEEINDVDISKMDMNYENQRHPPDMTEICNPEWPRDLKPTQYADRYSGCFKA